MNKDKFIEIWNRDKKKIIVIGIITLLLILGVSSYSIAKYSTYKAYKQKQAACEHDWYELYKYDSWYVDIYCPKCQLHKEHIRIQEWNKIKLDMEYRDIK